MSTDFLEDTSFSASKFGNKTNFPSEKRVDKFSNEKCVSDTRKVTKVFRNFLSKQVIAGS